MIQKLRDIFLDESIPSLHEYKYEEYLNPKTVYFPIQTDRTPTGEITIEEGSQVFVGQVIGVRDGGFFKQNIHSTVSGKYLGIEKKFYRSGKKVDCAVVENDFKETYKGDVTDLSTEEIAKLNKDGIIKLVEANSVIGLGGGAFPTSVKLQTDKNIDIVILNAVECEPYLLSDYYAIVKYSHEICLGLELAIKVYDAKIGYISVKSKNKELLDCLNKTVKELGCTQIKIKAVGNYYPQGYEKDVIKSTIGMKIKPTQLPADFGIMVINSTTSKAMYDAVRYNLPTLTREFLVTGQCINDPKVFEVKVGTYVPEIIEKCGGYKDEYPERVMIFGGPMMGKAVAVDEVIVTKAVSTVLVLPKIEDKEEPCVRCGSCVYSCPSKLSPVLIAEAASRKDKDALVKLNLGDCILCGMCSYVCTSKIPVTDKMAKAKKLL